MQNPDSVELVAFDFDGVLTDNRVLVFDDGREAVFCSRSDGLAFDMFRKAAVPVLILSKERNNVVVARGQKLGVPVLHGADNKSVVLRNFCAERSIELSRVMFVGNDLNDLGVLGLVGHSVCPADSHPLVLAACRVHLKSRGGWGVAREVAEELLGLSYPDEGAVAG